MAGTHAGDFLGMPPTHARIETSGIEIYRLEGWKISELARNGHAGPDGGIESQVNGSAGQDFLLQRSRRRVTFLDFLALW